MKQYIKISDVNVEYIFAHYLHDTDLTGLLLERFIEEGYGFGGADGICTFDCFHWDDSAEGHQYWSNLQDKFYVYKAGFVDAGEAYLPPNIKIDERVVL